MSRLRRRTLHGLVVLADDALVSDAPLASADAPVDVHVFAQCWPAAAPSLPVERVRVVEDTDTPDGRDDGGVGAPADVSLHVATDQRGAWIGYFSGSALSAMVDAEGRRIWLQWDPARVPTRRAGALLSGPLLAPILGRRGWLRLHGSVVRIGSEAVAFLGASGAGKSTLAAACALQGHHVLADDVVALRRDRHGAWRLHAPAEAVHLHEDAAVALLGDRAHALPADARGTGKRRLEAHGDVAPDADACGGTRLTSLYVLADPLPGAGPACTPLTGRAALLECLAHLYAWYMLPAATQGDALRDVAALAATVPVAMLHSVASPADLGDVVRFLESRHRR